MRCASEPGRELARVLAQPHRAAEIVHAEQIAQLVDHLVLGVSGEHSVESASSSPQTLRAYSTAAHWKP